MLTAGDKRDLLQLARDAITAGLTGTVLPTACGTPARDGAAAAFVTLWRNQQLRGCIGAIEADQPLGEVICRCALSAAIADPRFGPLTLPELLEVTIEISVLLPLEAVTGPQDVELGRHGLIVSHGARRGVLLPKVALEHGWTVDQFLSYTCLKAGLPTSAWQETAVVARFEAIVFSEQDMEGRR